MQKFKIRVYFSERIPSGESRFLGEGSQMMQRGCF
jgi:hypothetical protein